MDLEDLFGFGLLFGGFDFLGDIVSVVLGLFAVVLVVAIIGTAILFLNPNLGMLLALVGTGAAGVVGGGIAGAKLQKARYKYD